MNPLWYVTSEPYFLPILCPMEGIPNGLMAEPTAQGMFQDLWPGTPLRGSSQKIRISDKLAPLRVKAIDSSSTSVADHPPSGSEFSLSSAVFALLSLLDSLSFLSPPAFWTVIFVTILGFPRLVSWIYLCYGKKITRNKYIVCDIGIRNPSFIEVTYGSGPSRFDVLAMINTIPGSEVHLTRGIKRKCQDVYFSSPRIGPSLVDDRITSNLCIQTTPTHQ
ncbi:hypothetical protein CPB84DRAFT_1765477 [Gymnopilus junonius]|uniref:Uncharacterized protein n=1 Tax=Gymnopilus junonius TaxID=109634 RepID=A0A9P5NXJ7_GYMJU|nr:hypothetical protein CPB84DRAFT_1765477 [Gymnopilus junonius]